MGTGAPLTVLATQPRLDSADRSGSQKINQTVFTVTTLTGSTVTRGDAECVAGKQGLVMSNHRNLVTSHKHCFFFSPLHEPFSLIYRSVICEIRSTKYPCKLISFLIHFIYQFGGKRSAHLALWKHNEMLVLANLSFKQLITHKGQRFVATTSALAAIFCFSWL